MVIRYILISLLLISGGCATTRTNDRVASQTNITIHSIEGKRPEVTVGVTFDYWR